MNDLGVIDHFLQVFSRYIDSGFGLLRPEAAFLTATLVVIDVTLAGLYWAMGGHEDVIARLIKKTLYIGSFAFIITNFSALSSMLFRSFAGLGLLATGSQVSPADFLHPGRLASIGVDAARPLLHQIGDLTGFPEVFLNLATVLVLFLAWLVVIVSFFILAVQLFVTLIEFKLTTLAGFILVPFALWNRTAFLAERVLGNVVSAGVKVLVLAVIVGIGSAIFSDFHTAIGGEPSVDQALAIMLASLALLGLGIFGPGIATGLVSGGPQLGAGSAVGTAMGAAGLAVAGAAAVRGGMHLAARGGTALRSASSLAPSARATNAGSTTGAGSSGTPSAAASGAGSLATGASGAARGAGANSPLQTSAASSNPTDAVDASRDASGFDDVEHAPQWARRLHRRAQLTHGIATAAHVVRASDHSSGGASPKLGEESS